MAAPARHPPPDSGAASVASGSTALRGPLLEADVGSTIVLHRIPADASSFGFRAQFSLRNRSRALIALKFKTNNRTRYNIYPNRFLVRQGAQITVSIDVAPDDVSFASQICRFDRLAGSCKELAGVVEQNTVDEICRVFEVRR